MDRHAFQSGIVPAPIMPFNTDASIDWPAYDRYIASIGCAPVTAIAVNMAAAEATALEFDEQLEAVRRAQAAASGVPIISGLLAQHTSGAIDRARRLIDAGAKGLVVFPPLPTFISKPLPPELVADFHADIAAACNIPLIAFNTAAASYSPGTIGALSKIDQIVAIKDAVFDIERSWDMIEEAARTDGRVVVLTGNDTFVLEAMLLGSPGALIGLAGTFTAEIVRMQALAAQGKISEAYAIWTAIGPIARFIWSPPLRDYRPRMKYALMKQGIIATDTTRAPQTAISAADRAKMDTLFDRYSLAETKYRPQGA